MQHSSGTDDVAEFERRNQLLSRIAKGHPDTLRAFAAGECTVEEVVEWDMDGNLKHGLTELRVRRAAAAPPAPSEATVPETASFPSAPLTVAPTWMSHALTQPGKSTDELLAQPLWPTLLGTIIPSLRKVTPQTRRRYATSVRVLSQKLGAFGMEEAQLDIFGGIEPDHWEALERGRMRGMTVATIRGVVALPASERVEYLRAHNLRVGDALDSLNPQSEDEDDSLKPLSETEWETLLAVAEYPVAEEWVLALERAETSERESLRSIARRLSRTANIAALVSLSDEDWELLHAHWGAGAADWNHMRRALSACLSRLFADRTHPFRQYVIQRIPLADETERIPNVSKEQIEKICSYLPTTIRNFPWFLVLSGCRIGEYLRMEKSHLLTQIHAMNIPGTKTRASRGIVFIGADAWHIVEEAVPCHYATYRALRQQWITACEQAGVTGVTMHDLRHCSGQFAADLGVSRETIQAHLRHATPAMTEKYMRRADQAKGARVLSNVVLPHVSG